jgi:hypothetical protein
MCTCTSTASTAFSELRDLCRLGQLRYDVLLEHDLGTFGSAGHGLVDRALVYARQELHREVLRDALAVSDTWPTSIWDILV